MSLRTTIHATLLASPAVVALIGQGAGIRHYRLRGPDGATMPYLVSQEIVSQPHSTHGSATDAEDTLDETLVQFTAVTTADAGPDSAAALLLAVRAAFIDPTVTASRAVLVAAGIVVTNPRPREVAADELDAMAPQLDLTFFHNPQT